MTATTEHTEAKRAELTTLLTKQKAQVETLLAELKAQRETVRRVGTDDLPLIYARLLAGQQVAQNPKEVMLELLRLQIAGKAIRQAMEGKVDPTQPPGIAQLSDPSKLTAAEDKLYADLSASPDAMLAAMATLWTQLKTEGLGYLVEAYLAPTMNDLMRERGR